MSTEIIPYEAPAFTREQQLEHIYAQVASGRALVRVLKDDDGMPHPSTFWRWHMRDEDIRDNLAHARQNGVEARIDMALDVANTPMMGEEIMQEVGSDGAKRRVTRKEMLGHRRLIVETHLKYAQMIAPRKYGAKLDLTSDGEKISSVASAIAEGNKRLAELEKGGADG